MPGPDPIPITPIHSQLSRADRWDHFLARWGWKRMQHRVVPGLYALGYPNLSSPVFVTANYTLSFDALRGSLAGMDGYILVLDTKGVNVWCAAGEGAFGTDELVRRIEVARLAEVVSHRVLILPQLGAPGIAAHEIKRLSGFRVEYGPVQARDLPEYLKTRQATPAMRQVTFTLAERLALIPIELVHTLLPTVIAAGVLYLLAGWLAALCLVTAVLAGAVLFPILLPWIPTVEISSKGFFLGFLTALPFAVAMIPGMQGELWLRILGVLPYLLVMPSLTAFLALNFTGSTPFTSRSGVKHEIFTYIPWMGWLAGAGLLLTVFLAILHYLGV
jgi:hypothetical protein